MKLYEENNKQYKDDNNVPNIQNLSRDQYNYPYDSDNPIQEGNNNSEEQISLDLSINDNNDLVNIKIPTRNNNKWEKNI